MQSQAHSVTLLRLTSRAHVNEGVVNQNQFVEVKLIGEPLAFGLMKDSLVIVVSGKENHKIDTVNTNYILRRGILLNGWMLISNILCHIFTPNEHKYRPRHITIFNLECVLHAK